MADISLAGTRYVVARDGKERLRFTESRRPSQPGEGRRMYASWRTDGPAFNSAEDLTRGAGLLSACCSINTDGRWPGRLMLGPAVTVIDCSGNDSGDTVEDAHDYAVVSSANDDFLYVLRGTRPAKIDLSDNTNEPAMNQLVASGSSIISTVAEDGSKQVSIGFPDTSNNEYVVASTINDAGGGADTFSDNDEAEEISIFFQGDDRVFGLGGYGNTRRISGNILSGTTDMKASAWETITQVSGYEGLTFTGGAMDKESPVPGTNRGPMLLNSRFGRFFFPRGAASANSENCRQMVTWLSPIDLSIPMKDGTLRQLHGDSVSWGLTTFHRNESVVQGYVTGQDGSERWFWQAVKDETTDDVHIIAWRPTLHTDLDQEHAMQPFPIITLTDTSSKFIYYAGTVNGVRTNPTWYIGHDDDVASITAGRANYFNAEYKDANYRFQTSGHWDGTDMRRHESMLMDPEAVEFISEDCGASDTITIGYSTDGGTTYTDLSGTLTHASGATLNGVVDTDGYQRVLFIDNSAVPNVTGVRTFKPRLTFAAAAATSSPKVRGYMRLTYWLRPELIDVQEITIDVNESARQNGAKVETMTTTLLELPDGGPIAFIDLGGNTTYAHVESAVSRYEANADQTYVTLVLAGVPTTSDD